MLLHIRPFFLICVIKHAFFSWIICKFLNCPYLCHVFFIVLDLRLTKVWSTAVLLFLCPYVTYGAKSEFFHHQFAFTGSLLR